MSKYTTEVRFICETYAGYKDSKGQMSVNQIIETARGKIFDFPYELFDENYKPVLEKKILKHFYTREIGAETVGLWKLWLDTRLNELTPYYNKLYESAMLKYNPLYDTDYFVDKSGNKNSKTENDLTTKTDGVTTDNRKVKTDGVDTDNRKVKTDGIETDNRKVKTDGITTNDLTNEVTGTNYSYNEVDKNEWDKYSDTPQGNLSDVADMDYLTNARNNTADNTDKTDGGLHTTTTDTGDVVLDTTVQNSGDVVTDRTVQNSGDVITDRTVQNSGNVITDDTVKSSGTVTITDTDSYLEHVFGKRGSVSYAKLIEGFRNTLLNIDLMFIHELDDLFMNLW